MIKRTQSLALLVAAGALLAVPAVGHANHKDSHQPGAKAEGKGHGKSKGQGRSCAKKPTVNKGFVVRGTLVSYTADNPDTPNANEANVVITVTGANRHARVSGELADKDATTPGVQVDGGSFTADGTPTAGTNDPFRVQLSDYGTGESPTAGDRVRIVGKVAVTRKKCAAAGQSVAERYGAVNIRKVKITDAD